MRNLLHNSTVLATRIGCGGLVLAGMLVAFVGTVVFAAAAAFAAICAFAVIVIGSTVLKVLDGTSDGEWLDKFLSKKV